VSKAFGAVLERVLMVSGFAVPDGSSLEELRSVQETMARIKADLLSELVGVRSS
jgi:hypothetical protein